MAHTSKWHIEDRIWLQAKLDEKFAGPTVVVSHMAPSVASIPEQYKNQIISAAYASNLDGMIAKASLWIHGHIHESMDYKVGDARVVCNPMGHSIHDRVAGWRCENPAFNPNFLVHIWFRPSGLG